MAIHDAAVLRAVAVPQPRRFPLPAIFVRMYGLHTCEFAFEATCTALREEYHYFWLEIEAA